MNYQLSLAQTTKVITTKPPQDDQFSQYTDKLMTPQGLSIVGGIGVLLLMQAFGGGNNKNKIANGYWGGTKEIATAKKKALKQIKSPECDSAALYIGKHKYKGQKQPKGSGGTPMYIPDVQRGTAVIGAPGSGKSFSAISPCFILQSNKDTVLYFTILNILRSPESRRMQKVWATTYTYLPLDSLNRKYVIQ